MAASLHSNGECVEANVRRAAEELTELQFLGVHTPVIPLWIAGGDLNARPDKTCAVGSCETPAEGLETDPDCWYRKFSGGHVNSTPLGVPNCGFSPSTVDRFYDTVWLSAGGGSNPAPLSFCEQFTRLGAFNAADPQVHNAANSCTDIVQAAAGPPDPLEGDLDKNRIDYIWAGWDTSCGGPEVPPTALAASRVALASADLGIDPVPNTSNPALNDFRAYSDHRAVHSLFNLLPATPCT